MSQQTENANKTFTAGEALEAYRRVKLSDGTTVVYAGADEPAIGITQKAAASGATVTVRLLNAPGTFKMTAGAAIAANKVVYGLASGKIDDLATGVPGVAIGVALEAATADGDIIEVLCIPAASGLRMVAGKHTTVAASDTVVTGLSNVLAIVAQLDSDPVDGAMHVTATIGDQAGTPAAGSVLIKSWKSTDGDATLIAGTTFGLGVNWVAFGY